MPDSNPRQDVSLDFLDERYSEITRIGSGAMGVVFKAHDTILKKWVAIKVLNSSGDSDEHVVRFQREAKAASKLKHENIVTIMDFGVNQSRQLYMVMDYIESEPLSDKIKAEGRIETEKVIQYVLQICGALSSAHGNGVIHRDLKPGNILVTADDTVYLVDFGIAKLNLDDPEAAKLTQSGAILGTPAYMSPEQIGSEEVSASSDLYSLGCVMFECLSGEKPFSGNTILDTMQKHESQPAPTLAEISGVEFPQGLEDIVSKLLAKDPAERFQSAEELQDAVKFYMEEGDVQEGQPEEAPLLEPTKSPYATIKLLAPVIVCLSLIALIVWFFFGFRDHDIAVVEKSKSKENTGRYTEEPEGRIDRRGDRVLFIGYNELQLNGDLEKVLSDRTQSFNSYSFEDCELVGDSLSRLKGHTVSVLVVKNSTLSNNFFDVVKNIDSLNTLCIDGSYIKGRNFNKEDFLKLSSLNYLERIDLENLNKIPDGVFIALSRLPKMKTLAIEGSKGLSNKALLELDQSRTFMSLQTGRRDYGAEFWKEVGKLEKLNTLCLETPRSFKELNVALTCLAASGSLKHLDLKECGITDEIIGKIADIHTLSQVTIEGSQGLTAQGVTLLQKTKLNELNLKHVSFSRSALLELSNLDKIGHIKIVANMPKRLSNKLGLKKNIQVTNESAVSEQVEDNPFVFTDEGKVSINDGQKSDYIEKEFTWLLKMTPLPKQLEFSNSNVTGEGFQYIYSLPLTDVMLNNTRISDTALIYLSYFPELRNLDLKDTDITDRGLSYLSGLNKLSKIDLSLCGKVTDSGLKQLISGCPNIENLKLSDTKLTSKCFAYFSDLESLEELTLGNFLFSDEDVEKMLTNKRLKRIDFNHNKCLTDSGLLKLAELNSLEFIRVSNTDKTKLTPAGIMKFRELRPDVKIEEMTTANAYGEFLRENPLPQK